MNTLVYAAVAAYVIALPLRLWLESRSAPARAAFLRFGLLLGTTYSFFALYLLTTAPLLRLLFAASSAFVPAALLDVVYRLVPGREGRARLKARYLLVCGALFALLFVTGERTIFLNAPRTSLGNVILASWDFVGTGVSLVHIAGAYRRSQRRVERARLAYLLALLGGVMLFSATEALARAWVTKPPAVALSFAESPVVLQGVVPPVGVVVMALLVAFVHRTLVLSRLLDLHEILSRLLSVASCGLLFVVLVDALVLPHGTLRVDQVHGLFLLFLATVVFLSIYVPLWRGVERRIGAWVNRRGLVLETTLRELETFVSETIDLNPLVEEVLDRLVATGRIPFAGLYLRGAGEPGYRLAAWRGSGGDAHPKAIPMRAFPPEVSVPRVVSRPERTELLAATTDDGNHSLLDVLAVDLLLPLVHADLVVGWLALGDEPWSDGFSKEEILRLRRLADRMALIVGNANEFAEIRDQDRLAALGTMAAGLAHEIRNPLAGMKGAADFLATSDIPVELREFVDIILEATGRLDRLVRQFLDYARPFRLELAPTDPNALVGHGLGLLRRAAEGGAGDWAPIEIVEELEPGLPEVHADALRLGEVVQNLLQNAVQAMPTGGRLTVRTRQSKDSASEAEFVVIQVEDTGDGIHPHDLDRIFLPFFTTRAAGTGLGLAISRRLARAHGGDLLVDSELGHGSVFTLRVPVRIESSDGPPRA